MIARNLVKVSKSLSNGVVKHCSTEAPSKTLKGSKTVITGERGINKATLLGRVGRDSEVRGTELNPVTIFPLATSLTLKTRDGEYVQKTEWHRVCVFKPYLRDLVLNNVKKGDRVYVSGSISYTSFTDKNDFQQKVTSILADDVITVSQNYRNRVKLQDQEEEDSVEEEEKVKGKE